MSISILEPKRKLMDALEGTDIENNPIEIVSTFRSRVMGDSVPDLLLDDEEDFNEIEVSRFSILDSLDEIGL